MSNLQIGLIWAQSLDGVIGCDGVMPWVVPADLKHFKQATMGCPVIMGRKTWQSLGSKPLPSRPAIVLSRSPQPDITTAKVVHSAEEAITAAAQTITRDEGGILQSSMVWVIGGGEIYRLFLPYADELHVSLLELHRNQESATLAPHIDTSTFILDPTRSDNDWQERSGDARWKHHTWIRHH